MILARRDAPNAPPPTSGTRPTVVAPRSPACFSTFLAIVVRPPVALLAWGSGFRGSPGRSRSRPPLFQISALRQRDELYNNSRSAEFRPATLTDFPRGFS